ECGVETGGGRGGRGNGWTQKGVRSERISGPAVCGASFPRQPLEVHFLVRRRPVAQPVGNTIMSKITAILPAAGLGTRMGAETPKQFLELEGSPILIHSIRRIASCELVTEIIIATRAEEVAKLAERLHSEKFRQTVRVVKGGDTRQESVAAALKQVAEGTEIVLVHDAVRPFVTREQI